MREFSILNKRSYMPTLFYINCLFRIRFQMSTEKNDESKFHFTQDPRVWEILNLFVDPCQFGMLGKNE